MIDIPGCSERTNFKSLPLFVKYIGLSAARIPASSFIACCQLVRFSFVNVLLLSFPNIFASSLIFVTSSGFGSDE